MTISAFAPRFDLSNMFLPSRAPVAPAASESSADAREQCFALVANGPPVAAEEVESHIDAVEVTVRWGSQVLSVSHLKHGKSFYVGEGADLALPEDVLGASRAPIVVSRSGGTYVIVPRGARGSVTMRGGESETLSSMVARNALPASGELSGASEIALAHGMSVTLEIGATRSDGTTGEPITFEIGTVRAGKVAPVGFFAALAGGATGFVGLSFIGHAAIVASLAMFMPAMSNDDSDAIDRDQMMLMQKFLSASAERETEQIKENGPSDSAPSGGGTTGEAHKDESGAAGTTKPVTTNGRMAIKGSETKSELSPKQMRELVAEFGMIGIVSASAKADPNAPASKWATEAIGSDAESRMGNLWSPNIGDAMGTGLGLTGVGEGGGGPGLGVGVGGIHTMGGAGTGVGIGFGPGAGGMGIGHGPGGQGHIPHGPSLRPEPLTNANGRLPAEVIQRIVRQNFGRFRACYETALRTNPSLHGRVATKFVIGRDGAVNQSSDAGSDLPDQQVVACVVRSFNSLSFPAPEGGVATVTYPIILTPGD